MSDQVKIERAFCNSCGQQTKHFVRAEHVTMAHSSHDGSSFTEELAIVECCGCENLAFEKRTHSSEYMDFSKHPAAVLDLLEILIGVHAR